MKLAGDILIFSLWSALIIGVSYTYRGWKEGKG